MIGNKNKNRSDLPSLHANSTRDRFTKESFYGIKLREEKDQSVTSVVGRRGDVGAYMLLGVLEYECVATEDGSDKDLEFHVRKVLAHARPMYHSRKVELTLSREMRIVLLTLVHMRRD